MVRTVRPKARETPTKAIPRFGNPAARTAAPQPPNTSQKVPKTSAAIRRDISMVSPYLLLETTLASIPSMDRKEQISTQFIVWYTEADTLSSSEEFLLYRCNH